ncbi:RNA-binding protein [Oceanobacillus piezotolerans]|uniref:RNA-binding protein n=1 Tax=Oceanobacillus piezotolerans TaxID=2448030 RepID=A0A498D6H1_9BACI|nr:RNA-binding protein [Oceanobacillus piezotolerans]RLL45249.1 RNA-binding protein [Oceanobacillus piezotolerans]
MDIYQHFRKDEQPFIDKVLSWKDQVERSFVPKLTDFVDPREQQILDLIIGTNKEDIKLVMNGGNEAAERKRAIIAPFYEEVPIELFQLTLLEATYHDKFISLEHRDVMGAFLSLGIKRQKLGDIYVADGIIQIVTTNDIALYIKTNLNSIKKTSVFFEEKPFSHLKQKDENWVEAEHTVSSLRLDAVMKEMYRISRGDASVFIKKQLVKVNYKVVEDISYTLQVGDMVSLRGKGRCKLKQINGQTKKEKWRIVVASLK